MRVFAGRTAASALRASTPTLRRSARFVIVASVVTGLVATPAFAQRRDRVVVHVTGLRNNSGTVGCILFDRGDAFPTRPEQSVARMFVHPIGGAAVCEFAGVRPGTYAIATFHDENGNGRMDQNFLGIPTEGVGCSNGARGHFGPPSFADARFSFVGGDLGVPVRIQY